MDDLTNIDDEETEETNQKVVLNGSTGSNNNGSVTIDFKKPLDFIQDHCGEVYANLPDKEKEELKGQGRAAAKEINDIANVCCEKIGLARQGRNSVQYLTPSKATYVRTYLWARLCRPGFENNPECISIFVEKHNGHSMFGATLEVNDNMCRNKAEQFKKHNTFLELPIKDDLTILDDNVNKYYEADRLRLLSESQAGTLGGSGKLRLGILMDNSGFTNEEYYQAAIKTVQALLEYYDHVTQPDKTYTAAQEAEAENVSVSEEAVNQDEPEMHVEYKNKYSQMLIESKNIIFHGAPGTGKTYLAKQIAADIVSNGHAEKYEELTKEQLKQIEFVQFHLSYDYTDFVEGLRPCKNPDGSIGFELKDGIFKKFADRASKHSERKYVFIIDEINRGEISKIFGELFFSIDPEYRGKAGEVSTQYSNLHEDPDKKFYIPENVYIIGTMNDIDRSVDTFDFAMRRRFRFIELRADDHVEILDGLDNKDEVLRRMKSLNEVIAGTQGLNGNYQIGAAYFLKLKTLSFDQLWTDYLQPLLQDYIQGMTDEKGTMEKFEKAYKNPGKQNQ